MEVTATTTTRGIKQGWRQLRRDRSSWSALPAALGLLLLVQVVVLAGLGALRLHARAATNVPLRVEMSAVLGNQRAHEFLATLQQQAFIADAAYVTKEQALERAGRMDPGLASHLAGSGLPNPFRDTVALTLGSIGDAQTLRAFLNQDTWKRAISADGLQALMEELNEKSQRADAAQVGTIAARVALAIAAMATLLVSTELVRRRMVVLREDLHAQKLMGAPPLMLLTPLATYVCALLLAAILVATVLTVAFLAAWPTLSESTLLITLRSELLQPIHLPWLLVEVGVIVVVGVLGTWMGMRGELK